MEFHSAVPRLSTAGKSCSRPYRQEQREGATVKASAWYHPFDWRDLLLFAMPVATIVLAMFWEAE